MIPIWRLTRNRYTRRVYEELADAGVTATRMVEYVADLEAGAPTDRAGDAEAPVDRAGDAEAPTDGSSDADALPVSVAAVHAGGPQVEGLDLDFSIPVSFLDEEWVVVATASGEAVGRALVSTGQEPHVAPLGQRMAFDGAYVRRLYVAPRWRGNGIATRLVRDALDVARTRLDAEAAIALIAADNAPSQWVFEANGFDPVRRHDYVRLGGREFRRVTDLGDRTDRTDRTNRVDRPE